MALRFQLSDTDNPFFDWIKQAPDTSKMSVDLSLLIDKNYGMNNVLHGYVGSQNIPPCT
jgi:hypothetical protein